ncbi:DUF1810 family protein [Sulfitobacter sp. JBTF-M27]|uniref:DUF1810 family protein n=1 Tax=Sulfitobacter sediminilitoris TaxID=2698830 RepID=A0A6P0C9E3_9RHOB|nr:DUF1810 domain-containing protein [Sulfitobacter sediminilitoris]NEK21716.1 DUF1810 family protein [Sulfitobacter sediminilitoris]
MPEPEGLARFVTAQAGVYEQVCAELAAGRKTTHWMWFIFPQLRGLGRSETARFYGLRDLDAARDYDAHEVLGRRLKHCATLVLEHPDEAIEDIMGKIDALKLRSCATLFERAAKEPEVFTHLLETFFDGQRCALTEEELDGAK